MAEQPAINMAHVLASGGLTHLISRARRARNLLDKAGDAATARQLLDEIERLTADIRQLLTAGWTNGKGEHWEP